MDDIKCLALVLIFFFMFILASNTVSASLECIVCQPGMCSFSGINIFNISRDKVHGGSGNEVRCRDTNGAVLGSNSDDEYSSMLIRLTKTRTHAQTNVHSNYMYPIYLSSNDTHISCEYGQCCSCRKYDTCIVSLNNETNAHIGDCNKYSIKVCCSSYVSDTSVPSVTIANIPSLVNQSFTVFVSFDDVTPGSGISNFIVENKITWTNGSLISDWAEWKNNPPNPGSLSFEPTGNNQTYYFRAYATDNAGNTGYSNIVNTTFDNENPNINYLITTDQVSQVVKISSVAWDNVSGIFNHTINCAATNPVYSTFVQCKQADPFGGISEENIFGGSCEANIPYQKDVETEINCKIEAEDNTHNMHSPLNVFFIPLPSHPIIDLFKHTIFITLGEVYYIRITIKNMNPGPDLINLSLSGTYPEKFAKFVESSGIVWMSSDKRNITVSLNPYNKQFLYLEIMSTDPLNYYTLDIAALSENFGLTDSDKIEIIVGFPTAFTSIEYVTSVIAILVASGLIYFKKIK